MDVINLRDLDNEVFFLKKGIIDLVLSIPIPAHIKNVPQGKYIFTNKINLKSFGLEREEELIGKTIHDLDNFMKPHWGARFADKIDRMDDMVSVTGRSITDTDRIFVSIDGIVRIQDMTKIPIYNRSHKVVAVLTYSHDKTDAVNLLSLIKIYKKVYKCNADIVKYFCRYLNINLFFTTLPTIAELIYLLYAMNYKTHSEIAKAMHKSVKTCETHITHINYKLYGGKVDDILNYLRISRGSVLILKDAKKCG